MGISDPFKEMNLIVPLLFALLYAFFDGSYSSLFMNMIIFVFGILYTNRVRHEYKKDALKLFAIVYVLYITIAFIYSQSFLNGEYFYSGDSSKYIDKYLKNEEYDFSLSAMIATYLETKDILYNHSLVTLSYVGNKFLGGATVYFMTLFQTMFGILSIMVLYNIMVERYGKTAYRYVLIYASFSFFLLYSNFIIRDIVIAYFFMEAIRILLKKYKVYNVFMLAILALATAGIRLQSGLFLFSFLIVYVYIKIRKTRFKKLANTLLVLSLLIIVGVVLSSSFYERTMQVVETRQEGTAERVAENHGLFSYFSNLPPGIKQLVLLFYTQICPFPPYSHLFAATTFSQALIGLSVCVHAVFWYLVSYTLICSMVIRKTYKFFSLNEICLLVLSAIYIMALTSQPDIRRMIPVYPVIYILYIKSKNMISPIWINKTKSRLVFTYLCLLIAYLVIKGF